jgi:hypothetical protein
MKIGKIELMKQLVNDPDRKPIVRILYELAYLTLTFGVLPSHYFSRLLFKKDRTNITDYFPGKTLYKIKPHFNGNGPIEILENKLFFDFFFKQFNIRVPDLLMYNHRNTFVIDNMPRYVYTIDQFKSVLLEIFRKGDNRDSVFIKKTYGSYGGDKVHKLAYSQLQEEERIKELFNEVTKSGYLFQATIKQHPVLNELNSSCVNTLRLDTFVDSEGTVEIITAYLRTSIVNNFVDNMALGGCGVGVDMMSGRLNDNGYINVKIGGVRMPTEHPVTHKPFNSVVIPYFNEVKRMVISAAGCVPNLRLIGWDIAISEDGPVLIEGNSDYNISGTDMICNGARSNPVFRKVLNEVSI